MSNYDQLNYLLLDNNYLEAIPIIIVSGLGSYYRRIESLAFVIERYFKTAVCV